MKYYQHPVSFTKEKQKKKSHAIAIGDFGRNQEQNTGTSKCDVEFEYFGECVEKPSLRAGRGVHIPLSSLYWNGFGEGAEHKYVRSVSANTYVFV
jgi:hypothetical protein